MRHQAKTCDIAKKKLLAEQQAPGKAYDSWVYIDLKYVAKQQK